LKPLFSSKEVIYLFLHVVAMLKNVEHMLKKIVIALGGKMTIVDTLFVGFEVV